VSRRTEREMEALTEADFVEADVIADAECAALPQAVDALPQELVAPRTLPASCFLLHGFEEEEEDPDEHFADDDVDDVGKHALDVEGDAYWGLEEEEEEQVVVAQSEDEEDENHLAPSNAAEYWGLDQEETVGGVDGEEEGGDDDVAYCAVELANAPHARVAGHSLLERVSEVRADQRAEILAQDSPEDVIEEDIKVCLFDYQR
jgi:hypothetical protein